MGCKPRSAATTVSRRIVALGVFLVLFAGTAIIAGSRDDGPIDWDRARALYQRDQRGEKLSPDDQHYLDRAKAERNKGNGPNGNGPNAQRPAISGKDSTALVPLTQLTGDKKYKGLEGGLYGAGSNQPPQSQRDAARDATAKIAPLDGAGHPSADGKIVLMSIGMSNTTMEFSTFKAMADQDPDKSRNLVIVNAAQGGRDAVSWTEHTESGGNPTWAEADRRLESAGVTLRQVQVIWIKQALKGPAGLGEFPEHAKVLQTHLEKIVALAKSRYPNLRLAYLSSRIYAGYAVTMLNPEPYAYEGAFAVRGVIEDQIRGNENLNADPARGAVKAPVILWGPYLWADGIKGREIDDLIYNREDLGGDGTHPSPLGREKVAKLLLKFFKTDETATPWFKK